MFQCLKLLFFSIFVFVVSCEDFEDGSENDNFEDIATRGIDGCESTLRGNQRFFREDALCSPNGHYSFGLSKDGEFALIYKSEFKSWSAGRLKGAETVNMQGDGNLVVRNRKGKTLWNSKTHGNRGASLTLQDDGRAVISLKGKVLWSVGDGPIDECPDDPNKTEPGVCGCGQTEGTCEDCVDMSPFCPVLEVLGYCGESLMAYCCASCSDSTDLCPDDPNKTNPGACGCGTADLDSDGDNAYDCRDSCPGDPSKTEPGECGCGVPEGTCDNDFQDDVVDSSTMDRKIMAGYQGWFNTADDGAGYGWRHWTRNKPNANNIQIDMWPDMTEYDPDELYETSFEYHDGSNAGLYSAYNEKTVVRHVKWMKDYGMDGVYVQRFICEAIDMRRHRDRVLESIRTGSEEHGRVFANMYDISCGKSESLVQNIKNDWMHLVDDLQITESDRYLRHNGRPVLSIWGFNVSGRPGSASQAMEIVTWLTETAPERYRVTLKLGVDDSWRYHSSEWQKVYNKAEVISPWTVGRYRSEGGADSFLNSRIKPDVAECERRNLKYMAVVFPGFSWINLKGKEFNHIPRNGGKFFWRQIYNAIGEGSTMVYVAMFDEVDEATAIFKVAATQQDTPTTGTFLTLDEDGYDLPSDWYLRLTGEASKMLRNEINLTPNIPISP